MKPISVQFQCFGPYVERQEVDFTQLEQKGLFLICGETGSGKTTILDAMCYALYGKSSGGLRGDMPVMRCKQALPEQETFVEFIFECNQRRYRFFRSLKPRKKRKAEDKKGSTQADFNTTYECQILLDGDFVPLADAKDTATFLNNKATELIGLTYEQFRQVIILPQGQFEKLLVSDSAEKETILVSLFHAQRWQRLAKALYEEADAADKKLKQEQEQLSARLLHYDCKTTDELQAKAHSLSCKLEESKKALTEADSAVKLQTELRDKALLENRDFELRAQREKVLKALLASEADFRQDAQALELAELAETLTPLFRDYRESLLRLEKAQNALKTAEKNLAQKQKDLSSAEQQQAEQEARRPLHREQTQTLLLYESKRSLYSTLTEKEQTVREAQRALSVTEKAAEEAEKLFTSACTHWEKSVSDLDTAREKQEQTQKQYLKGIGYILAQKLEEGVPCPVCGSPMHPSPATAGEDSVTEGELDACNELLKRAIDIEKAARDRKSKVEGQQRKAQEELAQARQEEAAALLVYEQTLAQCVTGISTAAELEKQIQSLTVETEAFRRKEGILQQTLTDARAALLAQQDSLKEAQRLSLEAESECGDCRNRWEQERNTAGFEDDSLYQKACMEAGERNRKKEKLIRFRTDLERAQQEYQEICTALEGRQQPDPEGCDKRLKEAQETYRKLHTDRELDKRELRRMEEEHGKLTLAYADYSKRRIETDEMLVFAKRLRGDTGISLQRYVLGVMLTAITAAANQVLKKVYGGRYQLYRTDESSGSAHKKGLELEVYSNTDNRRRSVTTLSGGEKFLVALCLAIGLSAVVQAQGHGVRLEAMFIDEGFGSLDRNSIQDALEVLQTIQSSSGTVGIISHVELLAEHIPAKIQITKTDKGSKCELHC